MTKEELIKRLEKIERALDKLSRSMPQASMIAYDVWHLKKELKYEKSDKQ